MAPKRTIEISVNAVDRSDPEFPRGSTLGILRFDRDDLTAEPEEVNPLSGEAIELLRGYIEAHDAKLENLRRGMKARNQG